MSEAEDHVSKHTTYNEKAPIISIRCESQAQKDAIDKLAVAANVPRNTFILDRVLGRNTGSITAHGSTPAGSNTTQMETDLAWLVRDFFNYIAEHGADDIPDDLLDKLERIEKRLKP